MPSRERHEISRAVLSPRPAPRKTDDVVVMAQEALASAALGWQDRAEKLAESNTRLKNRLAEVEDAHRKSLTVVKNVPALPNNHVFTKQLVDENHALRQETRALQRRLMQVSSTLNIIELAQHPLLQELRTHLRDLEVDLDRLKQENELLRTELAKYEQVKVLEARYQHLEEKARVKTALYRETTSRLEEVTTQLVEAQQQLAAQTEKLQVYSDQSAQLDDLQQEVHLLRSENIKLNETVATLSSRPFDALSNDLQKKNLWISQLEEEKRILEEDRARFQTDCLATRRTNDRLRHRVAVMTDELKHIANDLSRTKAECEQKAMEKEVAQLQLRFYTAPGDYGVMSAVGKAIKDMKKQQKDKRNALEDESNKIVTKR
ncbi:uncharacterized protein PITG_04883 [Phytophthora infestans T30-4]|uniref:Uncharacterized protein n=1 Tax=Phytophthora infestans (strain T30-4) TaxID=403677 RepID=D0N298_PHYIT|nr:uncharacterized protein PITG_04883 [Phytophthora infestans T30-4]EEY68427.1 conserved hypothetical protein [Phytophthora infestans T30-4]|eukprot:XP_002905586.1 conserved hypothetical protein [Phytophthora infestans T30-4]